jgi:hypothetical protein
MAVRLPKVLLIALLAAFLAVPFSSLAATPSVSTVLRHLGGDTFEPTLGAAPNGDLFYSMNQGSGVAIGFATGVWKSTNDGASWTDVTPKIAGVHMAPETYDPYVYVDPTTGRVFQFAMFPILTCSIMSWSDNGGSSWTTNPHGCGESGVWDHQTIVAAAPRSPTVTVGYPNVLVECVNALIDASCARSLDGGLSWVDTAPAATPVQVGTCDTSLHGHLKTSADGVLYLPANLCGKAVVSVSTDSGLTWTLHTVSGLATASGPDPTVAVDAAGTAYYAFIDDWGHVMLSTSNDQGATWTPAVQASPAGVTANLPALAAGKAGNVALAYVGTSTLPNGYHSTRTQLQASTWGAYVTVTTDGTATFSTSVASGTDPIERGQCGPGRCGAQVDFIDVVIAPNGEAQASFVDGCEGSCATGAATKDNATEAVIVTVTSPLLR